MKRDFYTSMRENLKDYMNSIKAIVDDNEFHFIRSGFRELDDMIDCFEKGKLYVIGGRPCMGKEEFMLSMIIDIIIESKLPVLLFSTNNMKYVYLLRLLIIFRTTHSLNLPLGLLDFIEWKKIDSRASILTDAPLFIHNSLDLPLDELLETAKKCRREKGIKIIFIDCLQMIDFTKEGENSSEKIAKVMYTLKQLACKIGVPIVVGSMLGRGVEFREGLEGKQPLLMDLSNSSYIEEIADVIMMVHRPELYQIYQDDNGRDLRGMMLIYVMKNALRPLGRIYFEYQQDTGFISQGKYAKASGSKQVGLKDLDTDNRVIDSLVKAFDLEDELPF